MSSTDRYPFGDCLTHRVCRKQGRSPVKSKSAIKPCVDGIRPGGQFHQSVFRNRGFLVGHKRSGPAGWGQTGDEERFMVRPRVSLADVYASRCASGASAGRLGVRICLGSFGIRMSPARGSCGFWRRTGGSRCYTCYIRSWLGLRKASCRSMSPSPTSRRLKDRIRVDQGFLFNHRIEVVGIYGTTGSYQSPPLCPRPLLSRLRLETPLVSPGGTQFGFLKSPPPSVLLSPLLPGLDHPSADVPP